MLAGVTSKRRRGGGTIRTATGSTIFLSAVRLTLDRDDGKLVPVGGSPSRQRERELTFSVSRRREVENGCCFEPRVRPRGFCGSRKRREARVVGKSRVDLNSKDERGIPAQEVEESRRLIIQFQDCHYLRPLARFPDLPDPSRVSFRIFLAFDFFLL